MTWDDFGVPKYFECDDDDIVLLGVNVTALKSIAGKCLAHHNTSAIYCNNNSKRILLIH